MGKTNKNRVGKCYELSAQHIITNSTCTLVHGTIQGNGLSPNPHAWVEYVEDEALPKYREFAERSMGLNPAQCEDWALLRATTIFDPVCGTPLPKDAYFGFFRAVEFKRYSYKEAAEMMYKYRTYGPWDQMSEEAGEKFEQDLMSNARTHE